MTKTTLFISVLFFSSLSLGAAKKEKPEWTKISSTEFSMAPFPAPGSSEEKEDFDLLHHYQDTRTQEQCDRGNDQEHLHAAAIYSHGYGPLSKKQFEESREVIKNLITLGDRVAGYFKGKFERPRPYMTDETLTPCTPEYTAHRAYPSGHATASALSACVLGAIYPHLKDELSEYGDSVGDLRVIVGAHHPSDVEAGQKLGREVCARALQEPSLQAEIKKIKN